MLYSNTIVHRKMLVVGVARSAFLPHFPLPHSMMHNAMMMMMMLAPRLLHSIADPADMLAHRAAQAAHTAHYWHCARCTHSSATRNPGAPAPSTSTLHTALPPPLAWRPSLPLLPAERSCTKTRSGLKGQGSHALDGARR